MKKLRMKVLAIMVATFGLGIHAQTTFEEISADLNNNGSLKFEITAKRLYAASQRVL